MIYPLITFPDIEAWATEWLFEQVSQTDYAWASKITFDNVIPRTDDRPEYLVVISRDGGPTLEHMDKPRIRVNVLAPTEQESSEITRVIGGLLLIARTDPSTPVVKAVVNGAFRVPDETRGSRRAFWANVTTTSI